MSEHFTAEDIVQLSKLARINLRDDEVLRLTSDLNIINESIEKLQELDLEAVAITASPIASDAQLREDIPATAPDSARVQNSEASSEANPAGAENSAENGAENIKRAETDAENSAKDGAENSAGSARNPYEGDLLSAADALSSAPGVQDEQFVVPQILGEE
jgi:aspartyl/glutamyl-tRNA(Asn/Gln) amidotransferase C subunit